MTAVKAPIRRPGGRTADVTKRVFATAFSLLMSRGYAAFTLLDLAQQAGVNRSTLYRRWPTKAALVLDAIAARIVSDIVLADTGTLRGDLGASLRGLAAFLQSPMGRAALSAAMEMERSADVANLWQTLWGERAAQFGAMFDRAAARSEIGADCDRETLFAAAAGAVYFRVVVSDRRADEAWIARVLDLLLPRPAKAIVRT